MDRQNRKGALNIVDRMTLFQFDLMGLIETAPDTSGFVEHLTQALETVVHTPLARATTAFRFAKLVAKHPDTLQRLKLYEEELCEICDVYQEKLNAYKILTEESA